MEHTGRVNLRSDTFFEFCILNQQVIIWFGAGFARFLFQKEGPWPIPDPKGWKWRKQSEGDAPKDVSSTST